MTNDDGLVPNPIADPLLRRVPREHAEATAAHAGDYLLVWRAAACLCASNWAGADQAFSEAGIEDHRAAELFKTSVHVLATLALHAAGSEQHAEAYFTQLIDHQHRLLAKGGK